MVPPKIPDLVYRAGLPTRSKDGCLTCKAKHLKCDETRPACLRCSQKGLQCGGYWQGIRWSFKHQPNLESPTFQLPKYSRPSSSRSRKVISKQQNTRDSSPKENSSPMSSTTSHEVKSLLDQPVKISSTTGAEPSRNWKENEPESKSNSQLVLRSIASVDVNVPLAANSRLLDNSSAFIINWFENVCPAWSGFDSDSNPIRKIASDLWGNSITVCSSLESMSAAFIASRDPSMRQPALQLMKRATDYMQIELQIVKNQSVPQNIPTSLLFSLFGLGTTICWVNPRGLGLPFFKEARQLLHRLNEELPFLPDSVDAERLEFFNKCMTYCNMLLSFVQDDDRNDNLLIDSSPRNSSSQAKAFFDIANENIQDPPHPWTGVSSLTSRLFSETVRLCRRFRRNSRGQYGIEPLFSIPFQDMEAEQLEEKLLDLEISSEGGVCETGDHSTPATHLALVAEAYRLASLLLLYQTFPNLVFLRLPGNVLPADDKAVLWQEWITPLSLHLVKVLERIPPTSGSRVIQPLLYISASIGLRQLTHSVDTRLPVSQLSSDTDFDLQKPQIITSHGARSTDGQAFPNSNNLSSYISEFMRDGNELIPHLSPRSDITPNQPFDVDDARHFVMQRLSILENSLPPTPVTVAKELVSAIWKAYDNNPPGSLPVHWIDVMEVNDLRSMFG